MEDQGHVLITQEDDEGTLTFVESGSELSEVPYLDVFPGGAVGSETYKSEFSHASDYSDALDDVSTVGSHGRGVSLCGDGLKEEDEAGDAPTHHHNNWIGTYVELRDSDYDTDLDMNDDKYLHPERYDEDITGVNKYIKACKDMEIQPVSYFIHHMQDQHLKLRYHGLGPVAMKALSVPLECNATIEHLDLEGNWIMAEGAAHLCRVLKENVFLTELNLSENKIENEGVMTVCRLLMENRTIDKLELAGNCIGDTIGETLFELLTTNGPVLKRLNLRHNHLEDTSAQWLRDALCENESLEYLDVSWNHFQTRGCMLLAEGLAENVALKELSVAMNGFGDDGGQMLGQALKENRTLLRLDASFCRLPLSAAGHLAQGLENNETLQYLNVAHNTLKAEGTMTMLTAIGNNETSELKLLNLGNLKVFKAFKELQTELEAEKGLEVIHGGVIPEHAAIIEEREEEDPWETFLNDPFTKLKQWVEKMGYRLVDVLKTFDKDQSLTISKEEFRQGIEYTKIDITEEQIKVLIDRLDSNNDGEIDYSELAELDEGYRQKKREFSLMDKSRRDTLAVVSLDGGVSPRSRGVSPARGVSPRPAGGVSPVRGLSPRPGEGVSPARGVSPIPREGGSSAKGVSPRPAGGVPSRGVSPKGVSQKSVSSREKL